MNSCKGGAGLFGVIPRKGARTHLLKDDSLGPLSMRFLKGLYHVSKIFDMLSIMLYISQIHKPFIWKINTFWEKAKKLLLKTIARNTSDF